MSIAFEKEKEKIQSGADNKQVLQLWCSSTSVVFALLVLAFPRYLVTVMSLVRNEQCTFFLVSVQKYNLFSAVFTLGPFFKQPSTSSEKKKRRKKKDQLLHKLTHSNKLSQKFKNKIKTFQKIL